MIEIDNKIYTMNELDNRNFEKITKAIFEHTMDKEHLTRNLKIKNLQVLIRIANSIVLCNPRSIFVNTGSPDDLKFINNHSIEKGEESHLTMEGHTIHFDLAKEQGRIVDRTYYIANSDCLISFLTNKIGIPANIEQVRYNMKNIRKNITIVTLGRSRNTTTATSGNIFVGDDLVQMWNRGD
jgi:phosphoenolpyruvate carboxykinase (GTP)